MGNLPPSSDLIGTDEFKDVLYQREHGYPGWHYALNIGGGAIAGMHAAAPLPLETSRFALVARRGAE